MKIVIDIPDEDYKFIKDLQFYHSGRRNGKTIERNVINAIKNGTPYEEKPKGELDLKYLAKFADKTPSYETVKQLGFAGSYEDYLKTICGADLRVNNELGSRE